MLIRWFFSSFNSFSTLRIEVLHLQKHDFVIADLSDFDEEESYKLFVQAAIHGELWHPYVPQFGLEPFHHFYAI